MDEINSMTQQDRPVRDANIVGMLPLISPAALVRAYPEPEQVASHVIDSRSSVESILGGRDDRVIVIVGPCSIHHPDSAVEYSRQLKKIAADVQDRLLVIMRVYFEKPRTTVGWKGLINDPRLDDTFDIDTGLRLAREILLEINQVGLPTATEMLEPITPQYISDLISLASIGARTTESPTHRQMASGLSMPVGFKNSTEGNLDIAINAMKSARTRHRFLGIDHAGKTCVVTTRGNDYIHLILRGGKTGPNYSAEHLKAAAELLDREELPSRLVVDCSHANSNKDYRQQSTVWNDVIEQRVNGNRNIVGLMLESNLKAGQQALGDDPSQLEYGVSITDGCICISETEDLLRSAYERLA